MSKFTSYRQIIDSIVVLFIGAGAYAFAFYLRFEFSIPVTESETLLYTLPILLVVRLVAAHVFALHRRSWRYMSLVDAVDICKASLAGSVIFAVIVFLVGGTDLPRSVYLLDGFLFPGFLIGTHVSARLLLERHGWNGIRYWKRVLIVGAGDSGQALIKELQGRMNHSYDPAIAVDDNRNKLGLKIHGVPVAGTLADVEELARIHRIDEVIIACHKLSKEKLTDIYNACERSGLLLKRVPPFEDILEGRFSPLQFQNIEIADLLPRSGVKLETPELVQFYHGKTILVTGAGGSIGSELVRQIAGWHPKQVLLLERSEYHLYEIDCELRERFPDTVAISLIGDVADTARVEHIMKQYSPQIVFHAAAYKHVPLMESNASEALKNNVLGTEIVTSLAMKYGVEKFVLISTDKAVSPCNVMGYTKRIAELVLSEKFGCSRTQYMAVRFGNVLDSAGSVVPLFRRQIASGGPVTVTHPEIERYFMTIPEAVQLVLAAGRMGKGGEIFVLDMGNPVRVLDLAKRMIELSGMHHVQVRYIGLRPGEKLTEELVDDSERLYSTDNRKISVIYPERRSEAIISGWISALLREVDDLSDEQVVEALKKIIRQADKLKGHSETAEENVVAISSGAGRL